MKEMLLILNLVIIAGYSAAEFNQNSYTLHNHHIELGYIKKDWVEVQLKNTFHNRTTRTFSAQFKVKKDLTGPIMMVLQAYKHVDNTYKKLGPFRFAINACEALKGKGFDIDTARTTNGNLTLCPVKKGSYYLKDYAPPAKSFPPLVPFGSYKADIIFFSSSDVHFLTIAWFGSVEKIKKDGN